MREGYARPRVAHPVLFSVAPYLLSPGPRMPTAPSSSSSSSRAFSLAARQVVQSRGGIAVLDGVDVSIGPRTRLGVVGPNGAGKTTLLRVLAGLDTPGGGVVARSPGSLR